MLLRPLVNRNESRLIYIRQSAPGIAVGNTTFSVPELIDLPSRMKTVTAAVLASLLPAARASRVDVLQALRSE